MADPTGDELQEQGADTFTKMGLTCIQPLTQVSLRDLSPSGSFSAGEHLEIDYLMPSGRTCLVGEITGRSDVSNVKDKYTTFRRNFELLKGLPCNKDMWLALGVPSRNLRDFRDVRDLKGIFIAAALQSFDVDLPSVPSIACFYKSDWSLLTDYVRSIGEFAQYSFLQAFDLDHGLGRHPLQLSSSAHALMRSCDKRIAGGNVGLADVYTFEASPYELLPCAQVYRRDMLPDLTSSPIHKYQRALIPEKLAAIRRELLRDPDFMFPNSILVVLSAHCVFSEQDSSLLIPETYGAISVIDGQHRLFSYADTTLRAQIEQSAKIMVTAVQFKEGGEDAIRQYSARTFIEINMNQTRVRAGHLDAIAYEILHQTHPRALAAEVIFRANRERGRLQGLFDTNQTALGKIQTATIITALKGITNRDKVAELVEPQKQVRGKRRQGYENLLGKPLDELAQAEVFVQQTVICLKRYFNLVARTFSHDWPERGQDKGSSLEYAKLIAAFVSLLRRFILDGLSWEEVEGQLAEIRRNLMILRAVQNYDSILFDPMDARIPSALPSTTDDYRFLNANRSKPTPISEVLRKPRRRKGR
jgi:DGQHR domain-containing protein